MAVEYRDVRPGARVANLRLRSFPLIVGTDYWVGGWADGCHSRVLRGTGRAPRDGGGLRAERSFGGPTARSAADLRYHGGRTSGALRLAARAGSHGGGDGVHWHLLAAGLEHPRGPGVRAAAGERPQGQERPWPEDRSARRRVAGPTLEVRPDCAELRADGRATRPAGSDPAPAPPLADPGAGEEPGSQDPAGHQREADDFGVGHLWRLWASFDPGPPPRPEA